MTALKVDDGVWITRGPDAGCAGTIRADDGGDIVTVEISRPTGVVIGPVPRGYLMPYCWFDGGEVERLAEVLRTFPDVRKPRKVARLLLMHGYRATAQPAPEVAEVGQ
ncbi:MAG TPA: hypothetical protein VFQ42_08935 [Mycobacterium sp.]|nr:hypothetical protein [Mycobacterium sp.]